MAAVEFVSSKHVLALAAALTLAAGCGAGSSQPSRRGVQASPSAVVTYRPTARPVTAQVDAVDQTLSDVDGALSAMDAGLQSNGEDGQ